VALLDKDFLARLEQLELISRRIRRGSFRGERRSTRKGQSVEFADHRPYGAGDDLRFLDWNLYARLDRLMTKLFYDEEDLAVYLVLDRSASMAFGDPSKALTAKRILAAIGYISLVGMNRVFLWSPGENREVELTNLRSSHSSQRLFDVLEQAEVGGSAGLDEPLRRWIGTRRPRGVLVLASDLMHPDGSWEHLRTLVRGGLEVHAIRVLTPQEIEPDIEGDLRLVDAEQGTGVDISVSPKLLARYQVARDDYDRRLDQFCRSRQITLLNARTDTPFETLVLDVLRTKGIVR
jgi:uncharacterized protein (DUF58 family)